MKAAALALMLLAFGPSASAHSGTLSYSDWVLHSHGLEGRIRLRPADFRYLQIDQDLGGFLSQQMEIQTSGGPCQIQGTEVARQSGPELWLHWSWHCPAPPRQLSMNWLQRVPGHLHLLRWGDTTTLLGRGARLQISLPDASTGPPGPWSSLQQHWWSGLQHIAEGWDHLAFLLGLLLLARRLGMLIGLVTGFTLGHSLSLLLSVLYTVQPPAASIELGIAASIIFAGLSARGARPPRVALLLTLLIAGLGWWANPDTTLLWFGLGLIGAAHLILNRSPVEHRGTAVAALLFASLFGLLHGFGFAGAIVQTSSEAERIWPLLLGFNLGVETGQLLFVIPAWLLLQQLRRTAGHHWWTAALRAVVCGLGSYWYFSRLLA